MMWLKQFMNCCNKIFNLIKALLPFIFTFIVILIFHKTNFILLKYYPATIDFLFFIVFFSSIFQKETVIQKIAKVMEPDIKPKALVYTRNLTYIWALFMFINFVIAFLTIFTSEKVWIFYNGFLSYFLVGIIFIVEYIIRINFKRKYDC